MAIKACHMRRVFSDYTVQRDDIQAVLDICEIALSAGQWDSAIRKAKDALVSLRKWYSPLHSESIQFYVVLIHAYFQDG